MEDSVAAAEPKQQLKKEEPYAMNETNENKEETSAKYKKNGNTMSEEQVTMQGADELSETATLTTTLAFVFPSLLTHQICL